MAKKKRNWLVEEEDDEEGNLTVDGRSDSHHCTRSRLFAQRILDESHKMWAIAAPAILASVSQFSLDVATAAFVGHLGDIELAAVSVVQNVLENFVYGVMIGMGSALETLCGQAVGAGQYNMLGIYMQRSWIITGVTALVLTPAYIFTTPLLKLLGQDKHISEVAGKYAICALPQIFAYAFNFPIQKFLQSQSRVWVSTTISIAVLVIHVVLNWIFVTKFGFGIIGAAVAGNISWWLLVLAQAVYIVSGLFPEAWGGFSLLAVKSLSSFVKLSLASAVMLCLELWYFTAVILMVGRLKHPQTAVDAIAICMNVTVWTWMVALGFNAAVSVRVSNELGAAHPKAAEFSTLVATLTCGTFGLIFSSIILAFRNQFPKLFSDNSVVVDETSKLSYFVAATIFLDSIQLALNGVVVGAGWQFLVAWINIGCYYVLGLPIGALLGYKFNHGVRGIWTGMMLGVILQTAIVLIMVLRTNWHTEAIKAEERVKIWDSQPIEDVPQED